MSDDRPAPVPTTREALAPAAASDSAIDVAVEDDDAAAAANPLPSKPAPSKPASVRAPDATPPSSRGETRRRSEPRMGETTRRLRTKMTLKIPDDEISRPSGVTPSSPPSSVRAPTLTPSVPPVRVEPARVEPPRVDPPRLDPPRPDPGAPILTPMRIISIEAAPSAATPPQPSVAPASFPPPTAPRPSAPPSPAPGTVSTRDDSWTPYQPTVADRVASANPPPVSARAPLPAAASFPPPPVAFSAPLAPPAISSSPSIPVSAPSTTAQMPVAPETTRRLDSMEEIPIVTEDDAPPSSGEMEIEPEEVTAPRMVAKVLAESSASPPAPVAIAPTPARVSASPPAGPAAPVVAPPPTSQPRLQMTADGANPALPARAAQSGVSIKDLPPMRSLAPTEPEALEVSFEDEEPVSAARSSEPEAEIAPEDMVSIESAPTPAKGADGASPLVIPPMTAAMATAVAPLASRAAASAPTPKAGKGPAAARLMVPSSSPIAPPPMSEAPTGRRKARPWWEELFNDDFIRSMAKITDAQIAKEVDFVEESLAVAKGAMLLDLGCGTGRHAIELTRRGYKVVGFDLSLPMLAKAAEEAQERSQKLNFVQGDMREMTFEDTFDGIYSWNTSFGFFEEDKNQQVIQRVHKALKKGGQFVLEVGNRDYIIRQAPSLAWFEGDGCICMDEMSIDWITSRMKVKRTMMMDDGRTKEIDYSVRIYSLHELGKILHDAGFRVAEVSGRCATPGVFFGNESPRTMILAEKK